jgi:hypothetical protein
VNKQFERRLRRLEQHYEHQTSQPKKTWLPPWLTDKWQEDTGLPFDTQERAFDSLRRMKELDMVTPADDGAIQIGINRPP